MSVGEPVPPRLDPPAEWNELRLQVGLMERDLDSTRKVIDKLSEGIEKIQEMNTNLVRMLAIHDQKHESHEKIEEAIEEDIKELHSRITSTAQIMQDRLDAFKREIVARLDNISMELHTRMVTPASTTQTESAGSEVSKTLKELSKWKYILMGCLLVIGWILGHVKWSMLLQLFSG